MESRDKCERELKKWIDSLVDQMNGMYCADLTEAAKIDSKMSDIKLRDMLIRQMTDEIRFKKLSERIMAEQGKEITYDMQVRIDGSGITYETSRNDSRSRMPSE